MSDKSSKMETRGNCENFRGQKHGGKTFLNLLAKSLKPSKETLASPGTAERILNHNFESQFIRITFHNMCLLAMCSI